MAAARSPVGVMCGAPAFGSGPAAFPKRRPGGLSLAEGWVTVQYVKEPGAMVQDAYRRHGWHQTMKGVGVREGGALVQVWEWATKLKHSVGLYLGVYPGPVPDERLMVRLEIVGRMGYKDPDETLEEADALRRGIESDEMAGDNTDDMEDVMFNGMPVYPRRAFSTPKRPPRADAATTFTASPEKSGIFPDPDMSVFPTSRRASRRVLPAPMRLIPTTNLDNWTPSVTPYKMTDTTYGRALNALRCAETALDVMHHACMDMYARYASFPDTRPVHLDFTLRNIVAKTVCYDDVWQTPKFDGVSMIDFDLLAKIRVVVGEGQAGMVPLDADAYWRVTLACNLRHYEIEVRRFRARLNEARREVAGVQRKGMIIGAMYANRLQTIGPVNDGEQLEDAIVAHYGTGGGGPSIAAEYAWAEHGLHVSNAVLGAARQLSAEVLADTETLYTVELPSDPHFRHELTLAELCRAIRV